MALFFPFATATAASLANLSARSFCWTVLLDGAYWAMMAAISFSKFDLVSAICLLISCIFGC